MSDFQPTANVPIKSAWASKINWIQVVAVFGTCATGIIGALNMTTAHAAAATAAVALIGQVATVIVKTFFTASVTPASAAKI